MEGLEDEWAAFEKEVATAIGEENLCFPSKGSASPEAARQRVQDGAASRDVRGPPGFGPGGGHVCGSDSTVGAGEGGEVGIEPCGDVLEANCELNGGGGEVK